MRSQFALVLLLLCPLCGSARGEDPPAEPATVETTAKGVMRVICDPRSGLANRLTLGAMLHSAEVRKRLAKHLLGSAEDEERLADVRFELSDDAAGALPAGVFVGEISVVSTRPDAPASKVLDLIAPVLTEHLRQDDTAIIRQAELTHELEATLQSELEELTRQYHQLKELEQRLGQTDLGSTVLSARQQRLEHLLQLQDEALLEQIALETRIKSLTHQISEAGQKAAKDEGPTTAEREVQKQIEELMSEFVALQKAAASGMGVRNVFPELRAAQIELARLREARAAKASEHMTSLRRDLEEAESAYQAVDRKQELLKNRVNQHKAVLEAAVKALSSPTPNSLRFQISVAEDRYRRWAQQLDEAREAMRAYQQPVVTVIQ